MRKDIFNGNIKKEYFYYVLVYLICIPVQFGVMGISILYISFQIKTDLGGRIFCWILSAATILICCIVLPFLELLVIRNYPKYERIRRSLFNSDCYFTGSTSNAYRGGRSRAIFDLVRFFLSVDEEIGTVINRNSLPYRIFSVFVNIMTLLCAVLNTFSFLIIIVNRTESFSKAFLLFYFSFCFVVVCLLILRGYYAQKVLLGSFKNSYALYCSLVDICVRRNNKKRKFIYSKDQLEQIEGIVESAKGSFEMELKTTGKKLVSFKVIDNSDHRVVFNGLFM